MRIKQTGRKFAIPSQRIQNYHAGQELNTIRRVKKIYANYSMDLLFA